MNPIFKRWFIWFFTVSLNLFSEKDFSRKVEVNELFKVKFMQGYPILLVCSFVYKYQTSVSYKFG